MMDQKYKKCNLRYIKNLWKEFQFNNKISNEFIYFFISN